jgi:hypothetical protein
MPKELDVNGVSVLCSGDKLKRKDAVPVVDVV